MAGLFVVLTIEIISVRLKIKCSRHPDGKKNVGFLIVLFSTLFQGCTPYNAPIIDLEQPPSQLIKTHLVEEGETLYSIACAMILMCVNWPE